MPVHVSSEIGRLRGVLVHTPGRELLAVTPSTREDYLYDDIIDAEAAQREHRRFIALLERFATVYQVTDLLEQVLASSAARELLMRAAMDIVPSEPLARDLTALDPTGADPDAGRGARRDARPPRQGAQRARLHAAPAPEPVLHARQRDGGGRPRARGLDALRHPVARRADHEVVVHASPVAGERGHPVRRRQRAADEPYARGGRRTPSAARPGGDRVQRAFEPCRHRPTRVAVLRADPRHRYHRGGDAQAGHGHPPRHGVHAGGPGSVRDLSAAFRRVRSG